MRIINLGLATALIVATPAHAWAAEFDGPFVGAQVGWQSEAMLDPESSYGAVPVDETTNAVTGGIYTGYDKTLNGRFVVGAEAGLDFASDDEVQSSATGTTFTVDPKYSVDLTARAGYLLNPQTLVYARGGYTNARVRTSIADVSGIQSDSDNQEGWLAGAGVERQLAPNTSARIEYRYSKFSEDNARNRVLAGLSYRF